MGVPVRDQRVKLPNGRLTEVISDNVSRIPAEKNVIYL